MQSMVLIAWILYYESHTQSLRKFTQLKFDLEAFLLEHLLAFQANGPNASLVFPALYFQALWRGRAWCHLQTA